MYLIKDTVFKILLVYDETDSVCSDFRVSYQNGKTLSCCKPILLVIEHRNENRARWFLRQPHFDGYTGMLAMPVTINLFSD